MDKNYIQCLNDNLITPFLHEKYSDLRNLIVEGCKDKEDGLVFAVRKNKIHIYYRGGRLLEITPADKGKSLKIYTAPKYAGKKNDPDNWIVQLNNADTRNDAKVWCENLDRLKNCVAAYYSPKNTKKKREGKSNAERQLQHKLELHNRDFAGEVVVIDNEYGVQAKAVGLKHLSDKNFGKFSPGDLRILADLKLTADDVLNMSQEELHKLRLNYKQCKVDLVTLFKGDDNRYKICLVELKKGYASTDGSAGIARHIDDFSVIVRQRREDMVASVKNLLQYKTGTPMNTIANLPKDFVLDEENIYVSILCYDIETELRKKRVLEKINRAMATTDLPNIHYHINIKSNNYTLTKEMLLTNDKIKGGE